MKGGIGLDISNGAIHVALLRGGKDLLLDTFVVEQLPVPVEGETPKEALARALRDIWQRYELAGYPVSTCIEAKDCILRRVVVPFKQEEKIRRTIRFEAENYLHACAIEDVIIEFLKVEALEEKSAVILAAGRKTVIGDHLETMKEAGLDPAYVDLDCVGLFNTFKRSGQYRPEGTSFLVDVGQRAVRMLFVADGGLRKIRSFRIDLEGLVHPPMLPDGLPPSLAAPADGLPVDDLEDLDRRFAAIDEELARAGGEAMTTDPLVDDSEELPIAIMEDEEYEALKDAPDAEPVDEGVNASAQDDDPLGPPLKEAPKPEAGADDPWPAEKPDPSRGLDRLFARVLSEAQRTFASEVYRMGIDTICLTGPGSRLAGVKEFFEDTFEVPVEYLSIDECVDLADNDPMGLNDQGAVAFGLALRSMEKHDIALDFRQEDFRFQGRFEKLRMPLLFTGVLLFLSLFFNALNKVQETSSYKESYENTLQHQRELYFTTFEEDPKNRDVMSLVRKHQERIKKFQGEGRGVIPSYHRFIDVLHDLGEAVKKSNVPDLVWIKVEVRPEMPNKSTYSAGSLGILADDGAASVTMIKNAINQHSTFFDAADAVSSPHRASGRTLCSMTLRYKENWFEKKSAGGRKSTAAAEPSREDGAGVRLARRS